MTDRLLTLEKLISTKLDLGDVFDSLTCIVTFKQVIGLIYHFVISKRLKYISFSESQIIVQLLCEFRSHQIV